MGLVDDFFHPWEKEIESFDEINSVLQDIFERWVSQGRQFAWRGVADASWSLHSSLYRRLWWTRIAARMPDPPTERELAREESNLLTEAHRSGLHFSERGRLAILPQLATLQHFGAPTRLVDVTLNAYIGLWFAVEKKHHNGVEVHGGDDGRLFAIDITQRLINEDPEHRDWEDAVSRPWKGLPNAEWASKTWAWKPAPFQARIAAQHGAFLLGGVPMTGVGVRWPKAPGADVAAWSIADVRRCTSLPLRFHKAEPEAGGVGADGQPAYTFRIKAAAKDPIRERLERVFGYSHRTMYPDFPGFAEHGSPHLLAEPPAAEPG